MLREMLFQTESDIKYLEELEAVLAKTDVPEEILPNDIREVMGDREYYGAASEGCQLGKSVQEAASHMKELALALHLLDGPVRCVL